MFVLCHGLANLRNPPECPKSSVRLFAVSPCFQMIKPLLLYLVCDCCDVRILSACYMSSFPASSSGLSSRRPRKDNAIVNLLIFNAGLHPLLLFHCPHHAVYINSSRKLHEVRSPKTRKIFGNFIRHSTREYYTKLQNLLTLQQAHFEALRNGTPSNDPYHLHPHHSYLTQSSPGRLPHNNNSLRSRSKPRRWQRTYNHKQSLQVSSDSDS